jgi:thiosulfate dehydrogenase
MKRMHSLQARQSQGPQSHRAARTCLLVFTVLVSAPALNCGKPSAGGADSTRAPLIGATAALDHVNDLVMDPVRDTLPEDPHVAEMVRRGFDIMRDTRRYAPAYAGNDLSCMNCHLNGGQKDLGWPLVGVASLFPQYRGRSGRLITLDDRIRDCFVRSMNGTAPPNGSDEILAVSAYLAWISRGQPSGVSPAWRGRNKIPDSARIAIEDLDPATGRTLFERTCAACHGADGQGVDLGIAQPGPLWGPGSWNDGAGAARVYTLAGYVRYAMPLSAPGSLTAREAQQIAAYITSQERPAFDNKEDDYPDGRIPVDAVYYTQRYATNPLKH